MLGLLEDLNERLIIGDGAMGTILYSHGVDQCFEELNLTHSEQVKAIHQAYIDAGSQAIQTNTYGANYLKLARYGLEEHVKRINEKAVNIAREVAGENAYVLGNIGGIHGAQTLLGTKEEVKRSFREQLYCLLLTGVDGLLLETYYNPDEIKMVLSIAREETNLPIITNVSMHEAGFLENGTSLAETLKQLEQLGADVVGVNCKLGPHHMIQSLKSVPLYNNAFLAAYPNASLPSYRDGKVLYEKDPKYFEHCAKELQEQGVRLFGGCCGTTPEHIRAIAKGVDGLQPLKKKQVEPLQKVILKEQEQSHTPLHEIAKKRHSIIVELDPPKHLDISEFLIGAQALKDSGIDALTLSDNSLATPRICNVAIANKLKQEIGITPLVHVTCRDRNLIGLQSHIMGLHTSGIQEVLAITGDPTKVGDFPGATSIFDIISFKLMELMKRSNQGVSFSGKSLHEKTSFSIASAFNPNVANLDRAVERLEKKIASGADYILTQPMYAVDDIYAFKKATAHLDIPIYIGVMPITSTSNAEFLHNEVPGIKLTNEIRERMRRVEGDRHASIKEGIEISKGLIDVILNCFQGTYFITPFMRYDMIITLVHYLKKQLIIKNKQVPGTIFTGL